MKRSEGGSAIARQWELLKCLPGRGAGRSTKELTRQLVDAGFIVSKRQVERDLLALSTIFPLHCNDASIPYGWRWSDHASLDLPGLTLSDALSLKVVESFLRDLLPPVILSGLLPRFSEANRKLAALTESNPNARWRDKVRSVSPGLNLQKIAIDAAMLETIQECLLADEQIAADYRGGGGKVSQGVRLHPQALVVRGPATYLLASSFDYPDVRRFALHRFTSAKRTYEASRRVEGFDVDKYLQAGGMEFGDGRPVRLEARVSPGLATVLRETPLAQDQSLVVEGERFRLTASHADSWQLFWWLLGQGDQIEVLAPPELRTRVMSGLSAALAQYQSPE